MKRLFKIIRGRMRLFFGFCPKCNSDAPELYECTVCNWYQTSAKGMADDKTKKSWWTRFMREIDFESAVK